MTVTGAIIFGCTCVFVAVSILVTALMLRGIYPSIKRSNEDTLKYLTTEDKTWLNSMQVSDNSDNTDTGDEPVEGE